jgi:hypothetical protein
VEGTRRSQQGRSFLLAEFDVGPLEHGQLIRKNISVIAREVNGKFSASARASITIYASDDRLPVTTPRRPIRIEEPPF